MIQWKEYDQKRKEITKLNREAGQVKLQIEQAQNEIKNLKALREAAYQEQYLKGNPVLESDDKKIVKAERKLEDLQARLGAILGAIQISEREANKILGDNFEEYLKICQEEDSKLREESTKLINQLKRLYHEFDTCRHAQNELLFKSSRQDEPMWQTPSDFSHFLYLAQQ